MSVVEFFILAIIVLQISATLISAYCYALLLLVKAFYTFSVKDRQGILDVNLTVLLHIFHHRPRNVFWLSQNRTELPHSLLNSLLIIKPFKEVKFFSRVIRDFHNVSLCFALLSLHFIFFYFFFYDLINRPIYDDIQVFKVNNIIYFCIGYNFSFRFILLPFKPNCNLIVHNLIVIVQRDHYLMILISWHINWLCAHDKWLKFRHCVYLNFN